MMWIMIDLHSHSAASDGDLSPALLIQTAAGRSLSALALTDHDTTRGLDEGAAAAREAGIRFIPGVEIEIVWEPGEFHLLGLGIDHRNSAFAAMEAELARRREARNREIIDRMAELGVEAAYDEVLALSVGHSVGRPHFAALLVQKGLVKNRMQAFDRYLGKGKPFYAAKAAMDFDEAAAVIKAAGGLPVLAHPLSLYVSWGHLGEVIKDLQKRGLMGLEAWHPQAKVRACRRLEETARSLGLYVTAGSDFHGSVRPERKLGITAGDHKIEDHFLDDIPGLARFT